MKRILFLGLRKSGKTTIIFQLIYNKILLTVPTLTSDYYKLKLGNKRFILNDITGQEISIHLWDLFYKYSDALIYTIDSEDYLINPKMNIYVLISVLSDYFNKVLIVITNYKNFQLNILNNIKLEIYSEISKYLSKDIKSINIISYNLDCQEIKNWLLKI